MAADGDEERSEKAERHSMSDHGGGCGENPRGGQRVGVASQCLRLRGIPGMADS